MINKFLGRLPNEDHTGYLISYDRITQTYPKSDENELLLGEQFFFAFETEEIIISDQAMNQSYVESSLPMEIITSSTLDFKVGDKIIFTDRLKFIIGVAILFNQDDITVGVGFNPQIKKYYTRLTLN